ncbi:hypothetical protein VTO42DRAFT_6671 [Malbranchea cinnamomea]
MAYDGYRSPQPYESQAAFNNDTNNNAHGNPQISQNTFFQPPYPDNYDHDELKHFPSGPPPSRPAPNTAPDQFHAPPREYQGDGAPAPSNQPTSAVFQNTAATASPPNASSSYLSPEIISQITATVIQQLKSMNFQNNAGPLQQQQQQQPPPRSPQTPHPSQNPSLSPFPLSASTQSDYSPSTAHTKVYTPPSPYKSSEEQFYSSPPPGQVPHRSHSRMHRRPTPEQDKSSYGGGMEAKERLGQASRRVAREETTMEKIWGHLFDRDGKPTHRLGQFLRGIAVHLIESFPPKNNLVVTPEKMQKYYEVNKVPGDTYPWKDIFDDRMSSISRLYRDVQAEHHLVQERLDEKPDIPGLTPRGFERWMTLMIQAHPDQEFQRLQKTVLEMPINNPDDKRERFPKELSRRLFPRTGDQVVRELLEKSIVIHCKVKPSVLAPRSSPKSGSHHHRSSSTVEIGTRSAFQSEFDRRRSTYTPAVQADPEQEISSRPIERERKPYSAQPGGGKTYEDPSISRTVSPTDYSPGYRNVQNNDWVHNPSHNVGGYKRSWDEHVVHANDRGLYGPSNPSNGYADDLNDVRYREEGGENDRLYDHPRHDQGRYENPAQENWDNDEDYYRSSGLLGGEGPGRHGPYDHDSSWPVMY